MDSVENSRGRKSLEKSTGTACSRPMGIMVMAAETMVTSKMVKKLTGETLVVSVFARNKCRGELFGMGGLRHVLISVRREEGGTVGIQVAITYCKVIVTRTEA